MGRTHGTISTAMGSPLLGDPSAPITRGLSFEHVHKF